MKIGEAHISSDLMIQALVALVRFRDKQIEQITKSSKECEIALMEIADFVLEEKGINEVCNFFAAALSDKKLARDLVLINDKCSEILDKISEAELDKLMKKES